MSFRFGKSKKGSLELKYHEGGRRASTNNLKGSKEEDKRESFRKTSNAESPSEKEEIIRKQLEQLEAVKRQIKRTMSGEEQLELLDDTTVDPNSPNQFTCKIFFPNKTRIIKSSYFDTTTAHQVIATIKHKFSYVLDGDPTFSNYKLIEITQKDRELEPSKTLSEYGIKGKTVLEFRVRDWKVDITDLQSQETKTLILDPNDKVASAVGQLMKEFPIRPGKDYGIQQVNAAGQKGDWLVDTSRLLKYDEIGKVGKAFFGVRPKLLKVKQYALGMSPQHSTGTEDVHLFIDVETTTVDDMLHKLIEIKPDSVANYEELFLSDVLPDSPAQPPAGSADGVQKASFGQGSFLDRDKKLSEYNITETSRLCLLEKPQPLQVDFSGEVKSIKIQWSRKASHVLAVVCTSLELDSSQYALVFRDSAVNTTIVPWMTLASQNVQRDTVLALKKKSGVESDPNDVPLWSDESAIAVMPRKLSQIRGVSVNQLICMLTSTTELDIEFVKCFLSTYHSLMTANQLVFKLKQRFNVPEKYSKDTKIIQFRVATVLKYWIELYSGDVGEVLDDIARFVDDMALSSAVQSVVERLKVMMGKLRDRTFTQQYQHHDAPPKPLPLSRTRSKTSLLDNKNLPPALHLLAIPPLEIARQITLDTFDIYVNIRMKEFTNQAWTLPNEQAKKKCPNLLALIDKFNWCAAWIVSSLVSVTKLDQRVEVFEHLIQVAACLKELNNFHMLVACVSGFNCSAASRLRWTKSKVNKKFLMQLENLEAMCSMNLAFKELRSMIDTASPPAIPYVGTYLKDLTFIEDGNPDLMPSGDINFDKRIQQYNVLSKVDQFQRVSYNLTKVSEIAAMLTAQQILSENKQYAESLKIEPRNATKKEIKAIK